MSLTPLLLVALVTPQVFAQSPEPSPAPAPMEGKRETNPAPTRGKEPPAVRPLRPRPPVKPPTPNPHRVDPVKAR